MMSGRMFSHREASCSTATACGRQPYIHSRPLGQSWRSQVTRGATSFKPFVRAIQSCALLHVRYDVYQCERSKHYALCIRHGFLMTHLIAWCVAGALRIRRPLRHA